MTNVLCFQEMDKLGSQKDQAHEMLVRHHECTQEMEFRHLEMIQKMRLDHQKTQQSTEWSNQMEYNNRAELDLKRRHLMEQKQQPKTLKVGNDDDGDDDDDDDDDGNDTGFDGG